MNQDIKPMRDHRNIARPLFGCRMALVIVLFFGVQSPLALGQQQADGNSTAADSTTAEQEDTSFRGIEIGSFRVREYHFIEGQKSLLRFTLFATVAEDDFDEMDRLIEIRRNKVRDNVIVATRLVSIPEFDDPELETFRRRVLLRLHRSLPELIVHDIYVSDFHVSLESM